MLLFGPLIQQLDFEHSDKDDTGLKGWCYMIFLNQKESRIEYYAVIIHVIIRRINQTHHIRNTFDSSLRNKNTGRAQGSACEKNLWSS